MGGIYISHFTIKGTCLALLCLFFLSCSSEYKSTSSPSLVCTLPDSVFRSRNYSAHKAYQAPIIDGKILENSWTFARWASIETDTVKFLLSSDLKYKFTWDEDAIYILFVFKDLNGKVDVTLKIGITNPVLLTRKGLNVNQRSIMEEKIPFKGLKNGVTLPIQFTVSNGRDQFFGRQGYLKLLL